MYIYIIYIYIYIYFLSAYHLAIKGRHSDKVLKIIHKVVRQKLLQEVIDHRNDVNVLASISLHFYFSFLSVITIM